MTAPSLHPFDCRDESPSLAQFTDRAEWRDKAYKTLSAFTARLQSEPDAVPALVSALDFRLAQTNKSSLPVIPRPRNTRELLRQVNTRFLPNKILLLADGGTGQRQLAIWLPFIAGAHRIKDRATAYVCENYVCKLPTTDPQMMARFLTNKN